MLGSITTNAMLRNITDASIKTSAHLAKDSLNYRFCTNKSCK